jgi:glycogen debranching enzyme
MNSVANGKPVVPRTGYIVEFNALWYNALCFCSDMLEANGGDKKEACLKVYKRTRLSFVERQMVGFEDEMMYHATGTISELFDGNPPFHGRGAMAFAMNVAGILRTMKLIDEYNY